MDASETAFDDVGSMDESMSYASTGSCLSAWKVLPRPMYSASVNMDVGADLVTLDGAGCRQKTPLGNGSNSGTENCDGLSGSSKAFGGKKQNHSEIEKRRRDKMNTYITELSSLVPLCNAMARKLDKLTVLRMAVQHMKTLKGSSNSYAEGRYKPECLSNEDLKSLILQASEGFLFVVGCDRGRILYTSSSVSQVLNYSQSDLLGQSWFDILHPKDVATVKDQLSSSDLLPREKLIDAKTMLPVLSDAALGNSKFCSGARRSFFCRMKCKAGMVPKEEADSNVGCGQTRRKRSHGSDRKYSVIHCIGYLKSWAPARLNSDEDDDGEGCDLSCLVAVGRNVRPPSCPPGSGVRVSPPEFDSRHNGEGKFIYVDQRVTLILGYLPQEMLGTSCYEYYHQEDIPSLVECHKMALQTAEPTLTSVFRFRTKHGSYEWMQTKWKPFYNPWTKDMECLVARNVLVSYGSNPDFAAPPDDTEELFPNLENSTQRSIGSRLRAEKIGEQRNIGNSLTPDLENFNFTPTNKQWILDASPNDSCSSAPQLTIGKPLSSSYSPMEAMAVANNSNSSTTCDSFHSEKIFNNSARRNSESEIMESLFDGEEFPASDRSGSTEGNDEAAMAVIMSLLEADAGLGGPVDFSGLPWPLP